MTELNSRIALIIGVISLTHGCAGQKIEGDRYCKRYAVGNERLYIKNLKVYFGGTEGIYAIDRNCPEKSFSPVSIDMPDGTLNNQLRRKFDGNGQSLSVLSISATVIFTADTNSTGIYGDLKIMEVLEINSEK
jgi:hypothetical protein